MERTDSNAVAAFEVYVKALTEVIGHADRAEPLRDYCTGLMMLVARKGVETLAAVTAPSRVSAKHQSLLHFVGQAPWSDEALMGRVREWALPRMVERGGPITAWIIDDTGFPKKGKHSVGVARQYCGQLGKQDNCQVAVSLSIANEGASLPIAWQLYLPEIWLDDPERRQNAKIPDEIAFQTKLQIAIDQIRAALAAQTPVGVVLAGAGYGADGEFRRALSELGLVYSIGVQPTVSVWRPGEGPLPPKVWTGKGRRPKLVQRSKDHKPLSAKALAESLPAKVWKTITWREGTNVELVSRFAAVRLRVASRDYNLTQPRAEEWFIVEWPEGDKDPLKYWLSTLPETMSLQELVTVTKMRWRIERDYRELKQELGLGHYEGRGWRGFSSPRQSLHSRLRISSLRTGDDSPSGFAITENCQEPPIPRGSRSGESTDTTGATHRKLVRHAA